MRFDPYSMVVLLTVLFVIVFTSIVLLMAYHSLQQLHEQSMDVFASANLVGIRDYGSVLPP